MLRHEEARARAADEAFPDPTGQRSSTVGWWLLPRQELPARQPEEDLSWRQQAACRGLDPDLFHPEAGSNADANIARQVCARCLVRIDCLEFAVRNNESLGIWGGLGGTERRAERRALRLQEAAGDR